MGNLMCKEQKVIYLKPEARASELGVLTLLIKSPKSQLTSAGSLLGEEWGEFSFEPTDSLLFKELEHLRTWERGASCTTHFRGEFISTCSILSEGCDRDEAVERDSSVACRDMGFKTASTERASIDKAALWEHMWSDKARWLPNLSRFEDWLTYCTPGPSRRKQKADRDMGCNRRILPHWRHLHPSEWENGQSYGNNGSAYEWLWHNCRGNPTTRTISNA
ncbi:hypothetical protein KP509_34G053200 [Ceratopteris richardii]|uniref:Uncharacterized protein n=1 Tax=Ceratopteris richardii TaxID=49495 RepID=A0A8T2QLX8_CERRI|nr:hypothetical protein KP509_34G053200 [Ceratopteris richardii]